MSARPPTPSRSNESIGMTGLELDALLAPYKVPAYVRKKIADELRAGARAQRTVRDLLKLMKPALAAAAKEAKK